MHTLTAKGLRPLTPLAPKRATGSAHPQKKGIPALLPHKRTMYHDRNATRAACTNKPMANRRLLAYNSCAPPRPTYCNADARPHRSITPLLYHPPPTDCAIIVAMQHPSPRPTTHIPIPRGDARTAHTEAAAHPLSPLLAPPHRAVVLALSHCRVGWLDGGIRESRELCYKEFGS